MSFKKIPFRFTSILWKHGSTGGWYFLSISSDVSNEIRSNFQSEEEGWGRLKAKAYVGNTEWDTAIWFDTKLGRYLLPVKAEIRKKEKLLEGNEVTCEIWI